MKKLFVVSIVLTISTSAFADGAGGASRSPSSVAPQSYSSVSSKRASKNSELGRVYDALIRDSKKQLSPSFTSYSSSVAHSFQTSLISKKADDVSYRLLSVSHAAMPWATGTSPANGFFSLK